MYRGKARKKRRIFPRNRGRRRLDSTVHDRRGRRVESARSIRLSSDGIPRRMDGTKIGKNVIAWLGGAEAAGSPFSLRLWMEKLAHTHHRPRLEGRRLSPDVARPKMLFFTSSSSRGVASAPLPLPLRSSTRPSSLLPIAPSSSARNRSFSPRPRRRQRVHQKQCRGGRGGERAEDGLR